MVKWECCLPLLYFLMVIIDKPKKTDIDYIRKILEQWTEAAEVEKYCQRIVNEIDGMIEFNMHFWIAKENELSVGIIGLSDPLPKVISFAKTPKPAEIKILYVDTTQQGKGIGRLLVEFIEKEAVRQNYKELLIRSAKRYQNTAYGFYQKLG